MDDVAAPFLSQAVTSGFAISNGLIDLKRAAAFYDRIVIVDADVFDRTVPEALGHDYEFLQDCGIIEVLNVAEYPNIPAGRPGYEYADRIRGGLAAAIFATSDVRRRSHEACGNGLARLQAAVMSATDRDTHVAPIVTGRDHVPALRRSGQFKTMIPLPEQRDLEELLPVRATATRLVFERLPVPSREMPWEDVLQFRGEASTGLYAARLRLLLQRLAREDSRGHVEDLIRSEFDDDFEVALSAFKGRRRRATVRWTLPWLDKLHGLAKAVALLKFSEILEPHLKVSEELAALNAAEAELKKNPFYLIEHTRTRLA